MDRDPIFSKTLKLLHSNSKDAEDQLKSLLEEVVKQKYGISKTFANFFNKKVSFVFCQLLFKIL